MQQSRKERQARSNRKRARRRRTYTIYFAVLLVMLAGIYYIWDNNWNESLSPKDPHKASADMANGEAGAGTENDPAAEEETDVNMPQPELEPTSVLKPEPQPEADREISIALVGDIMMGGRIDAILKKKGFDYPYRHVHRFIDEVDIAVGNLENPITDRGVPYEKTYTFRTSPEAVPAMKESGFDVFNLANNHTLDFGLEGLRDTIRYLDEAGLGRIGAGENEEEAFRAYTIEKDGVRIDCLGFTNVVPDTSWKAEKRDPGLAETYNYTRAVKAIEKAEAEADIVVVMVHWGKERVDTPERYMIDNARRYIDAGADLVVGSHPHVLQGIESYKGKWIAYSLGNFIFTVSPNGADKHSAIVRADCGRSGDCRLRIIPVETGIGQPYPIEGEAALSVMEKLNRLSVGAEIKEDGEVIAISSPSP